MSNIYTYIDSTHFALATFAGRFLYGSHLHLCLAIHPLEVRALFQGFDLQDFCWSWLWKEIVCHIWRFKCCNKLCYLVWYVHFVLCILYLQAVTYLSDQSRSNFWHPKSLEGELIESTFPLIMEMNDHTDHGEWNERSLFQHSRGNRQVWNNVSWNIMIHDGCIYWLWTVYNLSANVSKQSRPPCSVRAMSPEENTLYELGVLCPLQMNNQLVIYYNPFTFGQRSPLSVLSVLIYLNYPLGIVGQAYTQDVIQTHPFHKSIRHLALQACLTPCDSTLGRH